MQIKPIDYTKYAHKPDPVVFKKHTENVKVKKIEETKKSGMNFLA